MHARKVLRLCIVLILALALPACSKPPAEDVSKTADVSAGRGCTTTMAFAEGPDTGDTPDIVWRPCYLISNHGTQAFKLLNITLDIPYGVESRTGRKLDLVQVEPVNSIKIFRTTDEIQEDRPTSVQNPPVTFEPGESEYIMPQEALMITVDGVRLPLPRSVNLLDYLGPILQLVPRNEGGYHCSFGTTVDATMATDRGSVTRPVQQALLPVGCSVTVPNEH